MKQTTVMKSDLRFVFRIRCIALYLLFLSLFSCQDNGKMLDKGIQFPITKTLYISEKYNLESDNILINPAFLELKNNFLVIASFYTDTAIFVYSTPNLKLVNSFGRRGNGPDDFLFPSFCKTNTASLYLKGYSNPMSIKKVSVNNSGEFLQEDEYKLEDYTLYNDLHLFEDSILLYKDLETNSLMKIELNGNKEISSLEFKYDENYPHPYSFNDGILASNGTFCVYVYTNKREIDIYDSDLKLHKKLQWNYNKSGLIVDDSQNSISYYLNVYAGKNRFYALYTGSSYNQKKKAPEKGYFLDVFDYEGNPIIRYEFDKVVLTYVVDEENNLLYGFDHREDGYIYKLQLDDFVCKDVR
jgi:hypothetical protein